MKGYSKEIQSFITQHVRGTTTKDLVKMVNSIFNADFTETKMHSYKTNHKLKSGTPSGRRASLGTELYPNHKPVGSERINKDGYTLVKTAEPNVWKLKHKLIWEAANGKTPKGCVVTFLDGDKRNFALENLVLISQAENAMMERFNLRSKNPEFTKTGILIAKVTLAGSKNKKKLRQATRL